MGFITWVEEVIFKWNFRFSRALIEMVLVGVPPRSMGIRSGSWWFKAIKSLSLEFIEPPPLLEKYRQPIFSFLPAIVARLFQDLAHGVHDSVHGLFRGFLSGYGLVNGRSQIGHGNLRPLRNQGAPVGVGILNVSRISLNSGYSF